MDGALWLQGDVSGAARTGLQPTHSFGQTPLRTE